MYGSSKPWCGPYKLTYIYNSSMDELSAEEVDYKNIGSMPRFFSIRRHHRTDVCATKPDIREDLEKILKRQKTLYYETD